jgi:hypothetical protein
MASSAPQRISRLNPTVGRHPAALREEARRRLVQRILASGGVLVLVLLLALMMWRRWEIGSPRHALVSVREAFREHDGTRLAYYADVDAIAEQVAGEGVDWLMVQHRRGDLAALRAEVHDIGTAPDTLQRIQLLKDALAERGGEGVGAALSGGTGDSASVAERLADAFTAMPPLDLLIGNDHLDFVSLGEARRLGMGMVVPVLVKYREMGTELRVSLRLERQHGRWRITGVEDFDETLSSIDDAQHEKLVALNEPVESRLEGMLTLGVPTLTQVPVGRRQSAWRLEFTVHNASPFAVRSVSMLMGTRGDDEHGEILAGAVPIAPGATVTTAWALDDTRARAAWAASQAGRLTVLTRSVEYDSAGTVARLHLFHSYAQARVHSAMDDSLDTAP